MTTLEKIRAEIEQTIDNYNPASDAYDGGYVMAIRDVLQIIDKYAEQEPCDVTEYDKDHIWYKGCQYISLRRFLEVKAEAEKGNKQMSFSTGFRKCQKCGKMGLFGKFCKECENYELEQKIEPCDDVVSRQAVEEMITAEMPERGMWEIEGDKEKETVCEVCVDLFQKLSELPPVRPQEQTGHWIHTDECDEEWQYRCSKCNMPSRSNAHRYCSNCGSYMYGVEPQESEKQPLSEEIVEHYRKLAEHYDKRNV